MADLKMKCTSCGVVLKLSASLTPGKLIKCPKCKESFRVPVAPAPPRNPLPIAEKEDSEEPADEESEKAPEEEETPTARKDSKRKAVADEDAEPKKPKKKLKQDSGSNKKLLWIGLGGGAAVLAGVLILVLTMGGTGDKSGDGGDKDGGGRIQRSVKTELKDLLIDNRIAMAVSRDGNIAAISGGDHTQAKIRTFDTQTGALIASMDLNVPGALTLPIALAPDNSMLAAGDDGEAGVSLFDPRTGRLIRKLKPNPESGTVVKYLAFSPKGDLLVANVAKNVFGWDCKTGDQQFHLEAHGRGLARLAFIDEGKKLVTAGDDNLIKIWNLATKKTEKEIKLDYEYPLSLAVSADGKFAALNGMLKPTVAGAILLKQEIQVWDLVSGAKLCRVQREDSAYEKILFLPDNTVAVVAHEISVHDPTSGANKLPELNNQINLKRNSREANCHAGVTAEGELVLLLTDGTIEVIRLK